MIFGCGKRLAIRNLVYFEVPTYQATKPFIKCYVVQIYHFQSYVFYCVLCAGFPLILFLINVLVSSS